MEHLAFIGHLRIRDIAWSEFPDDYPHPPQALRRPARVHCGELELDLYGDRDDYAITRLPDVDMLTILHIVVRDTRHLRWLDKVMEMYREHCVLKIEWQDWQHGTLPSASCARCVADKFYSVPILARVAISWSKHVQSR